MGTRKTSKILVVIMLSLLSIPADAATIVTDISGQVTGVLSVDVSGNLFDVAFVDDSCVNLFYGCNEMADFLFAGQAETMDAMAALLNQVLSLEPIASDPSVILGLEAPGIVLTPYSGDGISADTVVDRWNGTAWEGPYWAPIAAQYDTTLSEINVYAKWSPATTPAPSSLLLLFSLLVSGAVKRR